MTRTVLCADTHLLPPPVNTSQGNATLGLPATPAPALPLPAADEPPEDEPPEGEPPEGEPPEGEPPEDEPPEDEPPLIRSPPEPPIGVFAMPPFALPAEVAEEPAALLLAPPALEPAAPVPPGADEYEPQATATEASETDAKRARTVD